MRLYLRSHDRHPDPEPLPTNDRATILAGIVVWVALWIGAVLLRDRLVDSGREWWIWTPPAGIVLGFLGLLYLKAHTRRNPPKPPDPRT